MPQMEMTLGINVDVPPSTNGVAPRGFLDCCILSSVCFSRREHSKASVSQYFVPGLRKMGYCLISYKLSHSEKTNKIPIWFV